MDEETFVPSQSIVLFATLVGDDNWKQLKRSKSILQSIRPGLPASTFRSSHKTMLHSLEVTLVSIWFKIGIYK